MKESHSLVIADVESAATKESLTSIPALLDQGQSVQDASKNGSLRDVLCLSLPASTIFFAITIYAPMIDRLKVDYNATIVEYNLNITFALVGLALAPLVLDPFLKALTKRKQAVLGSWLLFIVFSIGSAFVNNLGGLGVLRFFAFLFGGTIMSLLQASLIILPKSRSQHLVFSFTTASCLLGLSLGLVVGGLIEGHATGNSRSWSRYLVPILSVVMILPLTFFESVPQEATSGKPQASSGLLKSAKSNYRTTISQFITVNSKEWIVIATTLYLSQVYFFFVTLGAFPYAFGRTRGYTVSEVTLTFLSLVIGVLLSIMLSFVTRKQRAFTSSQANDAEKNTPESSLRDLLYCCLLLPIGIFLFAWTASMPNVHWIAPMIGIIIFSFGSNVVLTYLNVYMVNIYQEHAQTALMCPFVSQALTASIAPLLTLFMIHNVTFGGSLSVLAGVLTGLTITPFILWRYGSKLRSKSQYAFK